MNTVGSTYQNVYPRSAVSQTNFSASPALVLGREKSVFAKTQKTSPSSISDVLGYGLLVLLSGSVLVKNEKIVEFLKKITDRKVLNKVIEKLKEQSSNLVSLYGNVKAKILLKSKALGTFKVNRNTDLVPKNE